MLQSRNHVTRALDGIRGPAALVNGTAEETRREGVSPSLVPAKAQGAHGPIATGCKPVATGEPDQPRERALKGDAEHLRDAELVALVLRTGHTGQDAVELAHDLLLRFGGVRGLLSQDAQTLKSVTGLGSAKVAGLLAVRELGKRFEREGFRKRRIIRGAKEARRYLYLHIAGMEREVFGALLLDARNRLLAMEDLFWGSVDRSIVYPREVLKACVRHNAAAIVLYHNHPSGTAEPSAADQHITQRLKTVLDEVDVTLVDHLVIGTEGVVSMAERGML